MRAFIVVSLLGLALTAPAAAQVVQMPTASQIYPYTPERAVREGVTGQATVRCQVQDDGSLKACAVVKEAPAGQAFGMASIKTAQRLVKAQPLKDGGQATVDVAFTWNPKE
jgi:periplasmic protein TonB